MRQKRNPCVCTSDFYWERNTNNSLDSHLKIWNPSIYDILWTIITHRVISRISNSLFQVWATFFFAVWQFFVVKKLVNCSVIKKNTMRNGVTKNRFSAHATREEMVLCYTISVLVVTIIQIRNDIFRTLTSKNNSDSPSYFFPATVWKFKTFAAHYCLFVRVKTNWP